MVSGKSKHMPWTESKSSGSTKVCFYMSKAFISSSIMQKYQVHHVILLQYKLKDIISEKELGHFAVWLYSLFLLLSYWFSVLKELLQFVLLKCKKKWMAFFLQLFLEWIFFCNSTFWVKAFYHVSTCIHLEHSAVNSNHRFVRTYTKRLAFPQ